MTHGNKRRKPANGHRERSRISKKISIHMPNDLFEQLAREAHSKRMSFSSVARSKIELALRSEAKP